MSNAEKILDAYQAANNTENFIAIPVNTRVLRDCFKIQRLEKEIDRWYEIVEHDKDLAAPEEYMTSRQSEIQSILEKYSIK